MFRFEKLDVWQKAVEYADLIYGVTRNFPAEERFGLTSQLLCGPGFLEYCRRNLTSLRCRFGALYRNCIWVIARIVSELRIAKRQRFLSEEGLRKAYGMAERL